MKARIAVIVLCFSGALYAKAPLSIVGKKYIEQAVQSKQAYKDIVVPLSEKGERRIVVLAASYNNKPYHQKHLDSVFNQKYENYQIVYIDDCSTDGTFDLVSGYAAKKGKSDKLTIIKNTQRKGALRNQYEATQQLNPTDLVVILDADDWFADNDVLSYINKVYGDKDIWMTYGQFIQHPTKHRGWNVKIPDHVVQNNSFRKFTHTPSHLRTYYAGLFQHIKKEDLLYEGEFFKMTGDMAAMVPMIEMAHKGHFKFIEKVLMVYNIGNPLNDHKLVKGLQQKLDVVIRGRKPYDAIESPFIFD